MDSRLPEGEAGQRTPTAEDVVRYVVASERQVRQRRTHQGGFDAAPPSADLLTAMRHGAVRDGTQLRIMSDEGRWVTQIAASVRRAPEDVMF